MLSRVADTIHWLARYMERTQSMLQVIRISYIKSQEQPNYRGWEPLLHTFGDLTAEETQEAVGDTVRVLDHLVFDRQNAASAYNNVVRGRENARAVQDHITKEVWQSLNEYYHTFRQDELARQVQHEDPVSGLDVLLKQGLLFAGTVQYTMPRDEGYNFLNLGKFLERALQTTDILRLNQPSFALGGLHPLGASELRHMLYALYGHELYAKTYRGVLSSQNVLHTIVYNPDFPHSLLYSLNQLLRFFERLRDNSRPESYEQVHFLIGRARNSVAYSRLLADDATALDQFLLQIRAELLEISTALSNSYFGNS